jgi:hypothetical protein
VKEWPIGVEHPDADILTSPALFDTLRRFYAEFNVRQQDVVFLVSENDGMNVDDSWALMSPDLQESLHNQLGYVMRNQLFYVRGFDTEPFSSWL